MRPGRGAPKSARRQNHVPTSERCGPRQKVVYRSQAQARKVALKIKHSTGRKLYVYECPIGGHFHLTHVPRGAPTT